MGSAMMPPQPLTMGMPDPATIAKQKDAYMKMLDEQVKQGTQVLEAQVKHQEMALDQQRMEQLMALRQQSAQQKAALEQQSMQLTMEYQQKKAEEEMQKQQFEMEKKQQEMPKFQGAGQLFTTPALGTRAPSSGQTYTYGPNGELVPK